MVDNQHKKITGYRDLSTEEIALMNEIKALASQCGDMCVRLRFMSTANGVVPRPDAEPLLFELDGVWVEKGTMDLKTGFMALVRAVAQPSTF